MNAKAEEKDVALRLFTNQQPRAKAAWLVAAKRGKPDESG